MSKPVPNSMANAAGVAYGRHLAVAGGVVVAQDAVVAAADDLAVFHYYRTEGAAVAALYAVAGLAYGEFHEFVHKRSV